jgi:MYXO-CTERM domain-containing protein
MHTRDKGFRRPAAILFLLLSGTLGAATFQQAGVGAVGYWTFDETSGTSALDSSGNGNNLTYSNPPPIPSTNVPTMSFTDPESLSFDGSSTYVSIATLANFPTGNTPHTTAGWVYVNAFPSNRAWILLLGNAANGAEHWLINSAGATQLGVYGGSVGSGQFTPTLTALAWHHIALTFDGTTLTGYLDGNVLGSGPATYNFAGVPLTVAQAHNGENFFNGLVDDLRLYDRALDPTEVAALAAGASGPVAASGLSAVPGNFSVTLNWTDSTGPGTVTYSVGRSLVSGGSPPGTYTIITSGLSSPTYIDSTVTNGTTYYYIVYADSFGQSAPSNEASATPNASVVTASRGKGETNCHASAAPSPGWAPALVGLGVLGLLLVRRR